MQGVEASPVEEFGDVNHWLLCGGTCVSADSTLVELVQLYQVLKQSFQSSMVHSLDVLENQMRFLAEVRLCTTTRHKARFSTTAVYRILKAGVERRLR